MLPNICNLSKCIRKSISFILNDSNLFSEWICHSPQLNNDLGSDEQQEFKDPTPIAVSAEYLKEALGLNFVNSDQEENINDVNLLNLVKYYNLEN